MDASRRAEFERTVLPHLGAAYSLARWLLRHPQDAEDAVQDSVMKAFRAFATAEIGNVPTWFLAIVRNTCLTALERRRGSRNVILLDEAAQSLERHAPVFRGAAQGQDEAMIAEENNRRIHAAIAALPQPYREVIVLREFHDLPYREIADVVGAPVGTVMSRLARARERLKDALRDDRSDEDKAKR